MKILLILTLSLFSGAQASSLCHPEMTLSELRALVEEVRDTHFPELENHDLPFQEYNSDSYYFQASIHISKLLRGRKKFCLDVNEELLACPPSTGALLAIITHELSHFQDYHRLPILGVAGLGVKYGLSKKYRRRYERLTDLKAVHLGHGRGLSEYRLWLYERLTPKARAAKKYYYLTPEEISSLSSEAQHPENPSR